MMGWEPAAAPTIGVLNLVSLALYLIPQTAVLGAIMLTGYFGGAVATHLRIGETGKCLDSGRVRRCRLVGAFACAMHEFGRCSDS